MRLCLYKSGFLTKQMWFARKCERNFGGNPCTGGPKYNLFFYICKFWAKNQLKIYRFSVKAIKSASKRMGEFVQKW